jgi:cyclohexanecarboxyl-CoA dehydrogenase
MAEFGFTEAQEMFRTMARDFTRRELMPSAKERMNLSRIPQDLLKKLAHAGFLGLRIPEKYGGQMSDIVTCGTACEETARADLAASFVIANQLVAGEILASCPEEVQAGWMPLFAKGEKLICFSITEPDAGSDAGAIKARATRDGDYYVLNGEKTSVTVGMQADAAAIWMKIDPTTGIEGITAFFVPLDLPGIEKLPFADMGFRIVERASINLDNVRIPAKYLVGEEGRGFHVGMRMFDWIRVILSLQVLALGEQSIYDAIDYARQRMAFGKPIAKYDAVSFRLVDSLAKIEAARLLCYKALWLQDQGRRATKEAAMAKSICPTIGIEACNNAMLTLGHVGYSSDYPVEQRLRDALGFQFADGTADMQRVVLVREFIGKEYLNYT